MEFTYMNFNQKNSSKNLVYWKNLNLQKKQRNPPKYLKGILS